MILRLFMNDKVVQVMCRAICFDGFDNLSEILGTKKRAEWFELNICERNNYDSIKIEPIIRI